jgi:hypothetical protein
VVFKVRIGPACATAPALSFSNAASSYTYTLVHVPDGAVPAPAASTLVADPGMTKPADFVACGHSCTLEADDGAGGARQAIPTDSLPTQVVSAFDVLTGAITIQVTDTADTSSAGKTFKYWVTCSYDD